MVHYKHRVLKSGAKHTYHRATLMFTAWKI